MIGRTFDRLLLEAATASYGSDLDAELRTLQEHALIESAPKSGELQFRHALIHEASYRSVLRADRVQIHGAVGETLVASGRAEAQPEIAAFHLGAAGQAARAVPSGKRPRTGPARMPASGGGGPRARDARAPGQLPEAERDETELNRAVVSSCA